MFVFLYLNDILICSQSVPKDIHMSIKFCNASRRTNYLFRRSVGLMSSHWRGFRWMPLKWRLSQTGPDQHPDVSYNGLLDLVIFWGHSSKLASQLGFRCNTALIKQRFWWPMMNREIQDFGEGLFGMRKEQVSQPTPCWPFAIPSRSKKTVVSHQPRFCYWPATLSGKHCGSQYCRTNFKSCSCWANYSACFQAAWTPC